MSVKCASLKLFPVEEEPIMNEGEKLMLSTLVRRAADKNQMARGGNHDAMVYRAAVLKQLAHRQQRQ